MSKTLVRIGFRSLAYGTLDQASQLAKLLRAMTLAEDVHRVCNADVRYLITNDDDDVAMTDSFRVLTQEEFEKYSKDREAWLRKELEKRESKTREVQP